MQRRRKRVRPGGEEIGEWNRGADNWRIECEGKKRGEQASERREERLVFQSEPLSAVAGGGSSHGRAELARFRGAHGPTHNIAAEIEQLGGAANPAARRRVGGSAGGRGGVLRERGRRAAGDEQREVQERGAQGGGGGGQGEGFDDLFRRAAAEWEDRAAAGGFGGRGRKLVQGIHVVGIQNGGV